MVDSKENFNFDLGVKGQEYPSDYKSSYVAKCSSGALKIL